MRRRGIAVLAAAVTLVLGGAGSTQAHTPTTAPRSTARILDAVVAQTGGTATVVTGERRVASATVRPATTPDVATLQTLVQDRGAAGYSLMAVLGRGQSQADYALDLAAGTELR